MAKTDNTFLTCIAKNSKAGETSNGNPYRRFGLVVQEGPRKGEWVNLFRVITPKTLKYYKEDCKAMGVTNDDPANFQCDGRLVTVKWGPSTNPKRPGEYDVLGVLPYDESKKPKSAASIVNTQGDDSDLLF